MRRVERRAMPTSSLRAEWSIARALFCLLLIGCANTRPLDPAAGPIDLAANEGILVLHIRTQVRLAAVEVAGASPQEVAGDVPAGEHLWFLAAARGNYRWRRIRRDFGRIFYYWHLPASDDAWSFTVEAGKINYPGVLEIEGREGVANLALRTFNRSAIAHAELTRRYPLLLERFPMRYAGSRRDDFLDHYLRAVRAAAAEEVGEP
jgi:hypothetical protein